MTTRIYDYSLQVDDVTSFTVGSVIRGNSSLAIGQVQAIDPAGFLKVKMSNTLTDFKSNESIHANSIITSGTANSYLNTTSLPFQANTFTNNLTYAAANVLGITPNPIFANKNAFIQSPIVRLYSIYYPGEWYPTNAAGNPTKDGSGRSWPSEFPIRFAEIVGDIANDVSYRVLSDSVAYTPVPIEVSGFEQSSDGKINDISLKVFNFDNIISAIVEDPFLVGNNTSNSVYAIVNGELLTGIDPRTVNASPANMGGISTPQYKALDKARNAGLLYDPNIVNYYGKANAAFDKTQTELVKGTWIKDKVDTRDILGAVVEVKSVFANTLDYWPEYSVAQSNAESLSVTLYDSAPYRVGDVVTSGVPYTTTANITNIAEDVITLNRKFINYMNLNSFATGIFVQSNGKNIYVGDSTTFSNITQYTLSIDQDIKTATYYRNKALSDILPGGSGRVQGFTFGTLSNLYIITRSNVIHQCNLAVSGDVTTVSLKNTFDIAAYETQGSGIFMSKTGNILYFTGQASRKVHALKLTTPYDLTTASYMSNANIADKVASAGDLGFTFAGDAFLVANTGGKTINKYDMTKVWDLTTATFTESLDVSAYIPSNLNGLFIQNGGYNVFFTGSSSQLYQAKLKSKNVLSSFYNLDQVPITGNAVFIINQAADPDSYAIDRFKVDQLESLNEYVATFGLVSWLQHFRLVTPKRKYYKNTCQFTYKGEECKYPGYGGLPIPGTNLVSNNNPIKSDNTTGSTAADDVCSKSIAGCRLRNNSINFGGFTGVGRTVPRM